MIYGHTSEQMRIIHFAVESARSGTLDTSECIVCRKLKVTCKLKNHKNKKQARNSSEHTHTHTYNNTTVLNAEERVATKFE